ncbi:type VII secretion-associated serine protease mycosin [Amycolatopsis sp. RM579]|uniref:Type VII secretion-associated serine protease mycosin n=1 Tax=Amycolatopsis pithecellobii TaxID=664692 RepID=A0A6N7YV78_9PSEU|nr:type VII secretion-associated serine protease mycosin [Amycolatopsis pithecellobii]
MLTAPAAPALAQPALPSGQQQACLGKPPASDPAVPWAQQQLAPQRVWTLTNGAGIVVGVVDTGVDANTPQLAGHVQAGTDVLNPGGGTGNSDCFGHGTFVAGIIAASPLDGTGFTGVAPGAQILPVRVANNADDVSAASIATGIRAAVDGGARVINVSASTTVQLPALQDAVAYAESRDVVLIASAANSAKNGDPVTYPASYPTVIAVGAIDSAGQRADFSQTGPYLGLVAPGVNVVSVGPGGPGQWQGSGTSYAAPFVTATAALIRAYRPGLSAAQVRHRLQVTADHPAAKLPDPELGWGTVNPVAAVSAVLPEESGDAGRTVKAEPAHAPVVQPLDKVGPLLVVLGLFVALLLAFVLVLWRRIGPAGHRRQWRRGRVIRPVEPPSPDREKAPDHA